MTSPRIDTETLRETLAAATPGPWAQGDDFAHDIHAADGDVDPAIGCVFTENTTEAQWQADARLIAMAPDLATETLRLRARVEALEGALRAVIDATAAYLPPDGIDARECINRILTATDNPQIIATMGGGNARA